MRESREEEYRNIEVQQNALEEFLRQNRPVYHRSVDLSKSLEKMLSTNLAADLVEQKNRDFFASDSAGKYRTSFPRALFRTVEDHYIKQEHFDYPGPKTWGQLNLDYETMTYDSYRSAQGDSETWTVFHALELRLTEVSRILFDQLLSVLKLDRTQIKSLSDFQLPYYDRVDQVLQKLSEAKKLSASDIKFIDTVAKMNNLRGIADSHRGSYRYPWVEKRTILSTRRVVEAVQHQLVLHRSNLQNAGREQPIPTELKNPLHLYRFMNQSSSNRCAAIVF